MNLHELNDPNEELAHQVQQGLRGRYGGWPEAEVRATQGTRAKSYPVQYRLYPRQLWEHMTKGDCAYWASHANDQ